MGATSNDIVNRFIFAGGGLSVAPVLRCRAVVFEGGTLSGAAAVGNHAGKM